MIDAKLQRADVLHDHHRNDEALALLNEIIAEDPQCDEAYFQKTWVLLDLEGRKKEALEAIDSALSIEPNFGTYTASKALVLSRLDRDSEALKFAKAATEQEPDLPLAWIAKSSALAGLNEWAAAEEAVREALELDPDDITAANYLSVYLRMQGKLDSSNAEIAQRLSQDAEDSFTHANAGWLALQQHNYKKAEEHCLESLRIESDNEYARSGLLEAYKARSWFYRLYLRWCFFIQKHSQKNQWIIIIAIYVGYRLMRGALATIHPALGAVVGVFFLLFVFGSWIASGLGHFIILKDSRARLALNAAEKRDAWAVGGVFMAGLLLLVSGLLFFPFTIAAAGGVLMASTLPGSRVFLNGARSGQVIFGGAALVSMGCAVATAVTGDFSFASTGIIICFLCTWLGMVPSLNRMPE